MAVAGFPAWSPLILAPGTSWWLYKTTPPRCLLAHVFPVQPQREGLQQDCTVQLSIHPSIHWTNIHWLSIYGFKPVASWLRQEFRLRRSETWLCDIKTVWLGQGAHTPCLSFPFCRTRLTTVPWFGWANACIMLGTGPAIQGTVLLSVHGMLVTVGPTCYPSASIPPFFLPNKIPSLFRSLH